MAGHSQFKNIMYRKGAQDAKRSKIFTKLIREITVAAREGADIAANPRLRAAVAAARAANMPKDNVERAIKKGAGGDEGEAYQEIRYEGYGAGGVALIIDALTDNRNRTASEVRAAFNKFGGSLGETNSVTFMFEHVGMITYPREVADPETMFEAALEAGATNVESREDGHEVTCEVTDFAQVRDVLEEQFGEGGEARLTWVPKSTVPVDEDRAASVMKLIEALEDSDDVQQVSANFEVADDVLARLTA